MDVNVFIPCAGDQSRWKNYLGVKKHLIPIHGEPILHRTVRLLNSYGVTPYITCKEEDVAEYTVSGAEVNVARFVDGHFGQNKLWTSEPVFSQDKRNIMMYGDVYFTEYAVEAILNDNPPEHRIYGRLHASSFTGCNYGEPFALSFWPRQIPELRTVRDRIIQEIHAHHLLQTAGLWDIYKIWCGVDYWIHCKDHWLNIDDWTEDFDYPHDYDNWIANYGRIQASKK